MTRTIVAEGRAVAAVTGRGLTGRDLTGRDLAGASATLTYYAGIAVVAWLLLVLWTTAWGTGPDGAEERWARLRMLEPPDIGGRPAYAALVGDLLVPLAPEGGGGGGGDLVVRVMVGFTTLWLTLAALLAWLFLLLGWLAARALEERVARGGAA